MSRLGRQRAAGLVLLFLRGDFDCHENQMGSLCIRQMIINLVISLAKSCN